MEKAAVLVEDPLYLGCLMIKAGDADGEIAGARNTTGNVLRPALQIIKTAPGMSCVSGAFIMTPNLKAFDEYDFSKADYSGQTIILANQLAVPAEYVPVLESFVSKGGKLIVDGLTGFYDGYVHNQMLTGFSLRKLFGGNISEFKKIDEPYFYHLEGFKSEIPGLMWKGTIRKDAAQTLSADNNEPLPLATKNHFGKGEVVWIPSLLGAGWSLGNYSLAS